MDNKEIIEEATKLLKQANPGMFVSVINEDGIMSTVSVINYEYGLALIELLVSSVLKQNLCCQEHAISTSMDIQKTVAHAMAVTLENKDSKVH